MPQCFILVTTSLLLLNALYPDTTVFAFAGSSVTGFIMPQTAYAAPRITKTSHKVALQVPVRHVDCSAHPCLALSFDDGPNPLTTPQVLSILETNHVSASFFLVGSRIAGSEGLVSRMATDRMEIGNHSWSHHDMTTLTPAQISDELTRTQAAIVRAGAPLPTLFRPPYGAVDETVVATAGLQTALWNEDPRDWAATNPTALTATIVSEARPGGVVDLHDIHEVTVQALPAAIQQLRAEGYQFVTVSELLHSRDRPGHAPFYGYKEAP